MIFTQDNRSGTLLIKKLVIPQYIIQKLQWKHHVSEDEVKQVLQSKCKLFFIEKGNIENENVYLSLGQTGSGRCLSIFFIFKLDKTAIVISARDMAKKERKRYEKK